MKMVDTRRNLGDVEVSNNSWLASIPALNRSCGLKDDREATRDPQIEKSGFVECDGLEPSIPDETRHILPLRSSGRLE